jgi:hypothetical protein
LSLFVHISHRRHYYSSRSVIMKRTTLGFIGAICLVVSVSIVHAEKKFTYSFHGVTVDSSLEFSSPKKAGTDALMMLYPKKSKAGKEIMGVTAVLYDRNAQKLMGMKDAGFLNYTRTVFMGSADAGKTITRVFAGKKIQGQVLNKKIPIPSTIEVYVITLAKGNKIGLGFNYSQDMNADEAQRVIAEIGESMRE